MSVARNIGINSLVYTITNFLQKGISFLLLPVYTRYLTPEDYGIISVVFAINGFLTIFFTLALEGAISRFYFEYKDEPEKLREFWGTLFVFIFLLSSGLGCLMLGFGEKLFKPVLNEIPFWPYAALGVATIIFLPFFNIFLAVLQIQQRVRQFSVVSLSQFGVNLILTIGLVVFAGWDAEGPLAAGLVTAVLFFCVTLVCLRDQFVICLKKHYLKEALAYSLPLIPHSLGGQLSSIIDRVFLNNLIGMAAAGLYNIGFMFGSILSYLAMNIQRAYFPVAMNAYKENSEEQFAQLKELGFFLMVVYSIFGTALSLFSKELIWFIATPEFLQGYTVVPFFAFTYVSFGVYYVLVTILFFNKSSTKFVSVATFMAALINIALNWTLIPHMGMVGAGLATLISQVLMTVFVGIIGKGLDPIRWNYLGFFFVPFLSFIYSTILLNIDLGVFWMETLVKLAAFFAFVFFLNYAVWRDGFYILRKGGGMIRSLRRSPG